MNKSGFRGQSLFEQGTGAQGMPRRDFLRLTGTAAMGLSLSAGMAHLAGCASQSGPARGYLFLTEQDVPMLRALAPAMLAGVKHVEQAEQAVIWADALIYHSSPANRKGFRDLLDALHLAPMRYYFTGLWKPFEEQSSEAIEAGVKKWWEHGTALGQGGARGISQAMAMAWYLQPENWKDAGYPGPPKKVAV